MYDRMFQSDKDCSTTRVKEILTEQLVELNRLRQHEEADPWHLKELKDEIKSDGILKFAIAVDIKTNIILDGEHRFNALKELGCKKIPVVFVDYSSPKIEVRSWRKCEQSTRKDVIRAGFSEKKLPPRTTKHVVRIGGRLRHISAIEKRVDMPLEKLGGDISGCS